LATDRAVRKEHGKAEDAVKSLSELFIIETDLLMARAKRSLPAGVYPDDVEITKLRDDAVIAIEPEHPAGLFGYVMWHGKWFTQDVMTGHWINTDGLSLDPELSQLADQRLAG
jgi:hypothetical protein